MRWYPDSPGPRRQQAGRDLLVAGAVLLFAGLAWLVRDAVVGLTAISVGFSDSASSAQEAWTSIGAALAGLPVIGNQVQNLVDGVAEATVGNAAAAGDAVTEAVHAVANTLALVTFAVPTVLLLVLWLPRRIAGARAMAAAMVALGPGAPADLLALRALCHLPLEYLLRFTPHPFEAYRTRQYAPLVQALYQYEGLAGPGTPGNAGRPMAR